MYVCEKEREREREGERERERERERGGRENREMKDNYVARDKV